MGVRVDPKDQRTTRHSLSRIIPAVGRDQVNQYDEPRRAVAAPPLHVNEYHWSYDTLCVEVDDGSNYAARRDDQNS